MSMTWERLGSMLLEETGNTLLMTLPATFFAYLIGLPLGVLLVITRKDGILPKPTLNRIIGVIVNLLRSVPFIILMVMLFPATRAILGRGTGTVSIIIPLTVSAFPYVARMVEGSLLEVDDGVVEAAQAMGSTTFQIVRKVLIPEAMPSLVNGFAICITTILGYTAMAGTAGGDGLGKVAITYGLNKRQYDVMYAASIVLVLLVQFFQMGGQCLGGIRFAADSQGDHIFPGSYGGQQTPALLFPDLCLFPKGKLFGGFFIRYLRLPAAAVAGQTLGIFGAALRKETFLQFSHAAKMDIHAQTSNTPVGSSLRAKAKETSVMPASSSTPCTVATARGGKLFSLDRCPRTAFFTPVARSCARALPQPSLHRWPRPERIRCLRA